MAKSTPTNESENVADDTIQVPDGLTQDDLEALTEQVKNEYIAAYQHLESKIQTWNIRLKLYNNQRRDPNKVGDPLLFTAIQTILASLYDDKMQVEFVGTTPDDQERAEPIDQVAKYDYIRMHKEEHDYYWDWDACFFGRGITLLHEFDSDTNTPVPELLDPTTFLRDPKAKSANGDALKHNGALRFWGRELEMTQADLENSGFINQDSIDDAPVSGLASLTNQSKRSRDEAQGRQTPNPNQEDFGQNSMVSVLQWWTHYLGKKCRVHLSSDLKTVVDYLVLPDQENWPLADRPLYPTARDWDGTSVCDLLEDKQRQRAIMANLAVEGVKNDVNQMYLFDKNKVNNRNDFNTAFNKHIPIDGNPATAVMPFPKANMRADIYELIMNDLSLAGQKATATPDLQQGNMAHQRRTLGELNLIASRIDIRYALGTRIFAWSERAFWQQWYRLYQFYFPKTSEKMVRVAGTFGYRFVKLTGKDIVTDNDVDIFVESKKVAEDQRTHELNNYAVFYSRVTMDPNVNLAYLQRKWGKLLGLPKDELDRIFPLNIDEMVAAGENQKLDKNVLPPIRTKDNHRVHLIQHAQAKVTKATVAHIKAHQEALIQQLENPDQFGTTPNMNPLAVPPGQPGETPMPSGISPAVTPTMPPNHAHPLPTTGMATSLGHGAIH